MNVVTSNSLMRASLEGIMMASATPGSPDQSFQYNENGTFAGIPTLKKSATVTNGADLSSMLLLKDGGSIGNKFGTPILQCETPGAGDLTASGAWKFPGSVAASQLWYAEVQTASAMGTVIGAATVRDGSGAIIGYLPVYDGFTP